MSRRRREFDPLRLLHSIKLIAFETALTIVFLAWLAKEVSHQLGWSQPPVTQPALPKVDVQGSGKRGPFLPLPPPRVSH